MNKSADAPWFSCRREIRFYWIAFVCGMLWCLWLFANSPGVHLHDEVGHVLVCRAAWQYPELLLDWWARVGFSLLYWVPSLGDMLGARLFSVLLACATVLLATDAAHRCGVRKLWLIPLLLWFQPWFSTFSYQAITEVPFSFFLIGGVALFLRDRSVASSIMIGMLPLTRHEGIALCGLWSGYMLLNRKWYAAVAVFFPVAAYNLVNYMVYGGLPFEAYFASKNSDFYGRGSWFYFVPRVAKWVGLPIVLLSLSSVGVVAANWRRYAFLLGYAGYFVLHVAIFALGLYESGGYVIFLLPLAPAFAITAAAGTEWIASWLARRRHQAGGAGMSELLLERALMALLFMSVLGSNVVAKTHPLDAEAAMMRDAAQWIRKAGIPVDRVVASHVWFAYYFDLPVRPGDRWDKVRDLAEMASGTYVLWDENYSERWGVNLEHLTDPAGDWSPVHDFGKGSAQLFLKK